MKTETPGHRCLPCLAAALLLLGAAAARGQAKGFEYEVGGRLMNDWTFASADPGYGAVEDGSEFRRARLFASGKLYERISFKLQIDFATGVVDLKDAYIAVTGLPKVGKVQIGHFLEPFTLELMTSSRFITFVERGLPTAFTQGRNNGLMLQNTLLDQRLQWALGAFRLTDDTGRNVEEVDGVTVINGDDFNITGRVSGLPWFRNDGKDLVHVGAAFSRQDRDDNGVRFRSRPEAHLLPTAIDTGTIAAGSADVFGVEAAFKRHAVSVQGEYVWAEIDTVGSPTLSSSYVFVSYFVTGEHRPYDHKKGGFSRVRPKSDFLSGPGHRRGAWELAARVSTMDLDDGVVAGGQLDNITLGVNWYLNPRTRVMLNYIHADRQGLGTADIVVTRFQVDF